MGPYAGVEYNLTESRLLYEHIYQGQPYICQVDLNPMPESPLSRSQGLWSWPLRLSGMEDDYLSIQAFNNFFMSGVLAPGSGISAQVRGAAARAGVHHC